MESEVFVWLASDNGFVFHCTIMVLLLLGGLGFPIPEDIPIILAGVAASKNIVSIKAIFLTCYIGVILADQLVYVLGYFFGQRLISMGTKSSFFPAITEERITEIREGLRKRRLMVIFLGRHLFPLRTVTFLTAGALRVPFLEFLFADALAALVSVSIVLVIGYFLGESLSPEVVSHLVHQAHFYILIIVSFLILGFLLKRLLSKKKVDH